MFKLPFVSRERYENDLRTVDQSRMQASNLCESLIEEGCKERMRYDLLLEKYHELRVSGATPAIQPMKAALPPNEPSDVAIEDVLAKRGNSALLRRVLTRYQSEQRRNKVDEDKIADAITTWRDPDSES